MLTTSSKRPASSAAPRARSGWMRIDTANVYYDHPYHAPLDHALDIDFVNERWGAQGASRSSSTRVGPRPGSGDQGGARNCGGGCPSGLTVAVGATSGPGHGPQAGLAGRPLPGGPATAGDPSGRTRPDVAPAATCARLAPTAHSGQAVVGRAASLAVSCTVRTARPSNGSPVAVVCSTRNRGRVGQPGTPDREERRHRSEIGKKVVPRPGLEPG